MQDFQSSEILEIKAFTDAKKPSKIFGGNDIKNKDALGDSMKTPTTPGIGNLSRRKTFLDAKILDIAADKIGKNREARWMKPCADQIRRT